MASCAAEDTSPLKSINPTNTTTAGAATTATVTTAAASPPPNAGPPGAPFYCYRKAQGYAECKSESRCLLASQRDSPWGMPGTPADRKDALKTFRPHLDSLITALDKALASEALGTDEQAMLTALKAWQERIAV